MSNDKNQQKQPKPARRRRDKDVGLWFQKYLSGSSSPEETLFKLNEFLNAGKFENTRKHVRAPVSVPVTFKFNNSVHKASSYTLSQRGAFIKCVDPPEAGKTVDLEIRIPDDSDAIEVKGRIVDSIPMELASRKGTLSGMAVVFRKLSAEDRRRIDKYVRAVAKRMRKTGG